MRRIGGLLVIGLLVGCVPKAKYDALETRLEECQERNQKREAAAKRRAEAERELQAELKPLIDKGILSVQGAGGRTVIGMRAEVLFPSGSADLSPEGAETVRTIASVLAKRTEDANFQVEGHTDTEPISTPEFPNNWYLGAARAIGVAEEMIRAGMPADRVSAATFGQNSPVAPNNSDDGRAKNRRIEIVVLPELDGPRGPRPGEAPKKVPKLNDGK
jgi:chemotaxis protein MotB